VGYRHASSNSCRLYTFPSEHRFGESGNISYTGEDTAFLDDFPDSFIFFNTVDTAQYISVFDRFIIHTHSIRKTPSSGNNIQITQEDMLSERTLFVKGSAMSLQAYR
jgi:hypothetical protein